MNSGQWPLKDREPTPLETTLPRVLAGTPLGQGNAAASLHIAVTDTAGQEVTKDTLVTVAPSDLHIVLVPESTAVVPGVDNEMMLFVTDPLGGPLAL